MSHYDIFASDSEELLSKLYATYVNFYRTKQEFVKSREAFMKVLSEQKGEQIESIVKEEKEKEAKETEEAKEIKEIKESKEEGIKSSPLFHKLALATHPDKHPTCNPIYFQQAQKANEQGKFAKLLFLSRLLKLETPTEFTEEERNLLQKAIEKKENKIQHYQKTYPWLYAQAESEELRKKILEAFFKVNAS